MAENAMIPKVAVSMIVFNGDYVLEASLESIYPFASQIIITEGPVEHYVTQGFMTSTDDTVEIIKSFPDPDKKIKLIQGQWKNKNRMIRAQTEFVDTDTDFGWIVDADEVYKQKDIQEILGLLPDYDSVAFSSLTFLGGFDYVVGGWEQKAQYHRIKRWNPDGWRRHRDAVMINPATSRRWREYRHLYSDNLAAENIFLYHYTYVWPEQVRAKMDFYNEVVSGDRIIPSFYENVWLPWVISDEDERRVIEKKFGGIHEWKPERRGPCFPERFTGRHPGPIEKRLNELQTQLKREIENARRL